MKMGIFAVWAKYAGNPHMAAHLLKVPDYRTFCGEDWRPDTHPPISAAYYAVRAVPQPTQLWGTMVGVNVSGMACDRCIGASWGSALGGRLAVLTELPPVGQPVGPQVALPMGAQP